MDKATTPFYGEFSVHDPVASRTHALNRGPACVRSPLDGMGAHAGRWCDTDPHRRLG